MADSPRAREAFFASHLGLFRSVVEIDPHTAVPNESVVHHLAEELKAAADMPVMCVLSTSPAPLVEDRSLTPDVTLAAVEPKPFYDVDLRRLSLGGVVLKRFSKPAENQEAILKVFDEEGWPPRIDDPLSGPTLEPIKRLHDTLDALNKAIEKKAREGTSPCWLKFKTDGTGQGVVWQIVWQSIATFVCNN